MYFVRVLLLLPVFHPQRNFYTVIIAIRKARADSSFNGRITRRWKGQRNESWRRLTRGSGQSAAISNNYNLSPPYKTLFLTSVEICFRPLDTRRYNVSNTLAAPLSNSAILRIGTNAENKCERDTILKKKYIATLPSENIFHAMCAHVYFVQSCINFFYLNNKCKLLQRCKLYGM